MANKPDYRLAGLNKTTNERVHNLGAGWKNADGSISFRLERFVVLPTEPEWSFVLFLEGDKKE